MALMGIGTIGPWTPQARRFGYRLVLRDTFSLVSFLIFLTTWIPRSPNIVARRADGELYGVFLLTLSFLSLYFYQQLLALRNVHTRKETSTRASQSMQMHRDGAPHSANGHL
jgi:hypothetical protein